MPEGNPAPPRPRRPEALISEMSYHIPSAYHLRFLAPPLTYPIMTLQYYLLGLIPIPILHRTLQICAMMSV